MHLPVRQVQSEIPPHAPGPARDFAELASEKLRQPSSTSERITSDDGTIILNTFDDYGKARDPYHQLVVGSDVALRYSIDPDDPTSACFESTWHFTFERDDWQVAIETKCSMSCDEDSFYFWRQLTATEGADEAVVLTKTWEETVPRNLL